MFSKKTNINHKPLCFKPTYASSSLYENIPDSVNCDAKPPENYQRLCHCKEKGTVFYDSELIY